MSKIYNQGKRIVLAFILTFLLSFCVLTNLESVSAETSTETSVASVSGLEGVGTQESPYLIKTTSDLEWFRDDVNAGNDYAGMYIQLYMVKLIKNMN